LHPSAVKRQIEGLEVSDGLDDSREDLFGRTPTKLVRIKKELIKVCE
jgi:hypothetical protein